jgi:hypothetical protein
MLGQGTAGRHLKFSSAQGGHDKLVIPEQGDKKLTLRDCIDAWEREHQFRHTLEQYHFSINAKEIRDMGSELAYVSGDMVVATLAKVGGSN